MGEEKESKVYRGKTRAYRRFMVHQDRTERLLRAGISGIEESKKTTEALFEKFKDVKAPRGRKPKSYEPEIELGDESANGERTLSLDDRSAALMRDAIAAQLSIHKDLKYHYHSILTVSMWGAFETYVYMLFEELFSKQPRMLKTNETLSFSDAFNHRNRIESHLADKTLAKIGHFSLEDSLLFIKEKINFSYSKSRRSTLKNIYLIRNIIAHNSGILRSGQEKQIPDGISAKDGELRISLTYLNRINSSIKASTTILEKHVDKKFYSKKPNN